MLEGLRVHIMPYLAIFKFARLLSLMFKHLAKKWEPSVTNLKTQTVNDVFIIDLSSADVEILKFSLVEVVECVSHN
jgi:hypothetical protein